MTNEIQTTVDGRELFRGKIETSYSNTLRNLALVGILAGGYGFYKSYKNCVAYLTEGSKFDKIPCVSQVRRLDYRIERLEDISKALGRYAIVDTHDSDLKSMFEPISRDMELSREFEGMKTKYASKYSEELGDLRQTREKAVTSTDYLKIKPSLELHMKKAPGFLYSFLGFETLLLGSIGLGIKWLGDRRK